MKTFLLNSKTKTPIIRWGMLPDNIFFIGKIPEGYDLAVCPSKDYIIVDVDRHGKKDGFKILDKLPENLVIEVKNTFSYPTKNNGVHYWFKYTGDKALLNKASGLGIDLRVSSSEESNGGYVKWHPRDTISPLEAELKARLTSKELNEWIESLFS